MRVSVTIDVEKVDSAASGAETILDRNADASTPVLHSANFITQMVEPYVGVPQTASAVSIPKTASALYGVTMSLRIGDRKNSVSRST